MKIVCFGTIYAVSLIVFWKVDFLSFLQDFQKFKYVELSNLQQSLQMGGSTAKNGNVPY